MVKNIDIFYVLFVSNNVLFVTLYQKVKTKYINHSIFYIYY